MSAEEGMPGRYSIPLLKRLHGSTTPGRGCVRRSDALQLHREGLKQIGC